jgi:hypothetical protein
MATLKESGASVQWGGTVNQPFLSVPGWLLRVNGQEVQAFEYGDDVARIVDTVQVAGSGVNVDLWQGQPRFWAGDSLVVLYTGDQPDVVALLSGALGQPQPATLTTPVPPTPAPAPLAMITQTAEAAPTSTPSPLPFTPPPPGSIPVLGTNVTTVEAVRTIPIRAGPADIYPPIGEITAKTQAKVTGISADGNWWRVTCPDGTEGSCWLSGDKRATRPIL